MIKALAVPLMIVLPIYTLIYLFLHPPFFNLLLRSILKPALGGRTPLEDLGTKFLLDEDLDFVLAITIDYLQVH